MSNQAILELASKEVETMSNKSATIRRCTISTGKEEDGDYRISLNVQGFARPIYISVERFAILTDNILHGVIKVEDAAIFRGAELTWDFARLCKGGETYLGRDGEEFDVQEDTTSFIELWNELIDVDYDILDKAEERNARDIASGRLKSITAYNAEAEQATDKKASSKEKARLAAQALASQNKATAPTS